MPDISIITPVYNGEKYIENCILSVHSASDVTVEHIVVDDGSFDATKDIVLKYPNVSLYSQKNQGATVARNHGLFFATGTYVKFLDADDELEASSLHEQLSFSEKLEGNEISYGYRKIVDEIKGLEYTRKRVDELLPVSEISNLILRNIQTSLSLYPSVALKDIGGFDEKLAGRQEWNLNLRLHAKGYKFVFWDGLAVNQRLHQTQSRISNRLLVKDDENRILNNTFIEINEKMSLGDWSAWASFIWGIAREFVKQDSYKDAEYFFDLAKKYSAEPEKFMSGKYKVFLKIIGPYKAEKIAKLIN